MKHALAVLAVVLFLLPVGASADNFKAVSDGSFNIFHSGGGNEGYGNAGGSGSFRLFKSHQHMGFLDFGAAPGLAAYVAAHPTFEAFVWVKASGAALGGKAAVVTIRTSNSGEIVEDYGMGGSDAAGDMTGIPGTSQAVAFRMADTSVAGPPPSYVSTGNGIEQKGVATFAGEPWKRPSTGSVGGSRSGTPRFYPGNDCVSGVAPNRTGFWDGELYAVEAVVGFHWSQASNTVAKFEEAGQLVNKNPDGSFLFLDPSLPGQGVGGWYKVALNQAIVLDMINNAENKGLAFSNWVAGGAGGTDYNNEVVSSEQAGGAFAPYLEITPEPATMVLLALGGLVALRRRSA